MSTERLAAPAAGRAAAAGTPGPAAAGTPGPAVELAGAADEPELRRLLRDNPMDGEIRVTFEREPDAALAAAVAGEPHATIVARRRDGSLCGMGSRAVADAFVDGRPCRLGYLSQLRLDRGERRRAGLLRLLAGGYEQLRERREAGEAPFDITTIVADNLAARRLLTAGLPGLPAYVELEPFVTLVLPAAGRRSWGFGRGSGAPAAGGGSPGDLGSSGGLGSPWGLESSEGLGSPGEPGVSVSSDASGLPGRSCRSGSPGGPGGGGSGGPAGAGAKAAGRRRPGGVQIVRGAPERLGAVAACLERNHRRHQFAPRFTAAHLASPVRSRGLAPGDFQLAVRGGEVIGCLALWDQSAFKQVVVRGYGRRLALLRPALNRLAPLLGRPRLPAPGGALPHAWISHVAIDGDDPEILVQLLAAARRAGAGRFHYLVAGFAARHPLLAPLRRRAREYRSVLYAVCWDEEGRAAVAALDGRIPHLEAALL